MRSIVAASVALLAVAAPAAAEVRLGGYFIARAACPAVQSIRTGANPGGLRTEPSRAYTLVAKNRPAASHFQIVVEGAEPARRWVPVDCGEHVVPVDAAAGPGGGTPGGTGPAGPGRATHVLAVSWQPAFCEGHGGKPECASQTEDRFDATNFTLHGLWPQPRSNAYCQVAPEHVAADKNGDWDRLPAPTLDAETRAALERVMPGTQSRLERHEWIKHGTCFQAESADAYFDISIALLGQLNASRVRDLFVAGKGREITGQAIRDAFDESFGDGAGERVRVSCTRDQGRTLIVELTIGLGGEIDRAAGLADLMAASEPTDPGCPRGIVDPVGPQ